MIKDSFKRLLSLLLLCVLLVAYGDFNHTNSIKVLASTSDYVNIIGFPMQNQVLTYSLNSQKSIISTQWQQSDSSGGSYTPIIGANLPQMPLMLANVGKYIKVTITLDDYSVIESTPTDIVVADGNIALNANATFINSYSQFPTSSAFDNNDTTRWAPFGNVDSTRLLTFELKGKAQINQFRIKEFGATTTKTNMPDFYIDYSNDGITWANILHQTTAITMNATGDSGKVNFPQPFEAKYIRFYPKTSASTSLLEFQLFNSQCKVMLLGTSENNDIPSNQDFKIYFNYPVDIVNFLDGTNISIKKENIGITPQYAFDSTKQILSLNAPWDLNTAYTVELKNIAANVDGVSNIQNLNNQIIMFKTVESDEFKISSTTAKTDIPFDSGFNINFTKSIDPSTVNIQSIVLEDSTNIPLIYGTQYTINQTSTKTIRINFTKPLSQLTNYNVAITGVKNLTSSDTISCDLPFKTNEKNYTNTITGYPMVYQTVYSNNNAYRDEIKEYQWYHSNSNVDNFILISNASGQNYVLADSDVRKYIKSKIILKSGKVIESNVIGPVFPAGNIALGIKETYATSTNGVNVPANAFDGIATDASRWISSGGGSKSLFSGFDEPVSVNRFALKLSVSNGMAIVKEFSIYYSNDSNSNYNNKQWTKMYEHPFDDNTPGSIEASLSNTIFAKYFRLEVTKTYSNNTYDAMIQEFELYNDIKAGAIISTPTLLGSGYTGYILSASASYILDENDVVSYQWQSSSSTQLPQVDFVDVSGATDKTFAIPYDFNGVLRCKVSIKNANIPTRDTNVYTDNIQVEPAPPTAPIVANLEIKDGAFVGKEAKFNYVYRDANQDIEKNTIYSWYIANQSSPEEKVKVKESVGSKLDLTGAYYTIKPEDTDKLLFLSVTPCSDTNQLPIGIAVITEGIVIRDYPKAINVSLEGNTQGKAIVGKYEYVHANGDANMSTYRWLVKSGGSYSPITGAIDTFYIPTATDIGKSIVFEVTPKGTKDPIEGTPIISNAVTIVADRTSSGTGGNSGNGGGSISIPPIINNIQKPEQKTFDDIQEHWAKEDIEYLAKLYIISGVTNKTFEPERSITRAELVSLIARAFAFESKGEQVVFTDINNNDWFYNSVITLAQLGIVSGYESNFRPNDQVTREEFAKIITMVIAKKSGELIDTTTEYNTEYVDFNTVDTWAKPYVFFAKKNGLMNGDAYNMFSPVSNVTRAQAATVIKRALTQY